MPQNVDSVWNVLYYHDLKPNGVDTAAFNRKIFDALKPGGIYLVIDHKAEDGSGWRDAGTIHRMGVDTIKQEVLAAGFELALESDLLANPADDRTQDGVRAGHARHDRSGVLHLPQAELTRAPMRGAAASSVLALAALPGAAAAHHSFFGRFDTQTLVELEGEVTDVLWRNPHAYFSVRADGVVWEIETSSLTVLKRMGIERRHDPRRRSCPRRGESARRAPRKRCTRGTCCCRTAASCC